ncbi:uncharacterized protein LOC127103950 [Lathyrus oleraceus]|uniref:uncharacterized protein LOC127103950 n=1 Tax=Pisum sativum TaxID=3888 RepID=UPI0021D0B820|nr:uncharacterized protein LOC127103950 [Pisum sativum]
MPNYTSPLYEYIPQSELPPRWKVPKFTKIYGDTNESTVEDVARYLIKAGEIANNKNLRIQYFPSSLKKNAFTWFTMLPANSIHDWTRLERLFHEQFYMGQSKISLKELAIVKRKFSERIDDYLNRFCLLKAICFTQVLEHELVEMAAGGLDYFIRKKLDTQYLRDMAQLVDRVRQVERLKAVKDRENKNNRRERVAYVELDEDDPETYSGPLNFDEREVDLVESKQGPPYSCKFLAHSNGKNPVELEKSDAFPKKTYTFDVTKCDEIFDLLGKDDQMIVPLGAKIPPLEQRKNKGFWILCRRLSETKDRSKSQMRINSDPLRVAGAHLAEPSFVNMVEVSADCAKKAIMVEVIKGLNQGVTEGFNKGTTEGFFQGVIEGFNKGITEGSSQMITTNETTEGFI